MKGPAKKAARIAIAAAVWLVTLCLPVVPVLESSVVPEPIYRSAWVSILQLIASFFLVGVRVQATWLTLPVAIGLIAAAYFSARALNRRIAAYRQSPLKLKADQK